MKNTATHKTTCNGIEQFRGTEDQCWIYILKHQSQSVHWATNFGGWKIEPIN